MTGTGLDEIELTILSLVAEAPRYEAEIQQVIEQRGLREWLIVGSASVGYVLGLLHRQELISVAPGEFDPGRTVYQITDAGRGVLQTAVVDLLRQPRPLAENFAVGLANIGVLKPQLAYRALLQHREALAHRLSIAELFWARRQQDETPEGIRALYTHGIALMQAELDWLDTFIADWQERHPVVMRDTAADADTGATTPLHRATAVNDPAKQVQRLKPPPKAE